MISLKKIKEINFREPVVVEVNHGNIDRIILSNKVDMTVSIPRYRYTEKHQIYCPLLKKLATITYINDGESNDYQYVGY